MMSCDYPLAQFNSKKLHAKNHFLEFCTIAILAIENLLIHFANSIYEVIYTVDNLWNSYKIKQTIVLEIRPSLVSKFKINFGY